MNNILKLHLYKPDEEQTIHIIEFFHLFSNILLFQIFI